jgi:hypothetical protein
MCSAQTVPPNEVVFTAGASVPPSTFAAAQRSVAGTGRLQGTVLTWPSGLRTSWTWFDTQLGEACEWFGPSTAPTRTCAVATPGVSMTGCFSDHGCTQPLAGTQTSASSCAPKYVATYADETDTTPRVLSVGARHSGNVYVGTPESCTQLTTPLDGWTLFETTGEVPLSQLATAPQMLQ